MNENRNVDLMISNYLNILKNKDLSVKLYENDLGTYKAMIEAIHIYAQSAVKFVDDYKRQQQSQQASDEVNKMFK